MATELEPIVGDWYSFRGRDFTVVDVDEDEGIVEIQYASGAVQQIDLNAWYDMDLEPSEEPEDWDADVEEDGADSSRWDDDDDEDDEEDLDDEDDEDEDEDDDWDDEDDEEEDGDEWEGQYRRRSDEDDSWDEH